MNLFQRRARTNRLDGRLLRFQDRIVQRGLRFGKMPAHGPGPGQIAGVAVQLAARVDQHQIPGAQPLAPRRVVQTASSGPVRHDGVVSHARGSAVPAAHLEAPRDDLLRLAFPGGAHQFQVSLPRDLRGRAKPLDFSVFLDLAQQTDRTVRVVDALANSSGHSRLARLTEHLDHPEIQGDISPEAPAERVASLQVLRQIPPELSDRTSLVHGALCRCLLQRKPGPLPAREERIRFGQVEYGRAPGLHQEKAPRLIEPGQVEVIGLVVEGVLYRGIPGSG